MNEVDFAAELFTAVTGDDPPEIPSWWELNRWTIEAELNDGTQPLFTVYPNTGAHRGTPLRAVTGGKVVLHLHEGQMRAWKSEKRFTFMIAGTQGGKTSFEPWLLARDIINDDLDTGIRGVDSLAVTATYDLFKLKFLSELTNVFVDILGIARYHAGARVLEIVNPETGRFEAKNADDSNNMFGRVILRSASTSKSGKSTQTSDGGGLESSTIKRAVLDECGQDGFSYNAWKAIRRRLSLAMGRVYGGTTPYNLGWLKQVIFDPWEKHEVDDIEVIQFASNMNPAFPDEEFESVQSTMQKHEFDMLYRGIFGRPAGAIYDMFVDGLRINGGHKVRAFEVPREWARYQGIDPGVINWAKVWAAHDAAEDVYYLYREQMGGERLTAKEHASKDMDLERIVGERVIQRAIGAKSEKYYREDYRSAGADGVSEPDTPDVEEGIDRVVTLLKQHRLYIFDDCVELVEQILSYSRVIDEFGHATDEIKDKSTYHLVDALRYLAILLVKPKAKKRVGKRKSYAE